MVNISPDKFNLSVQWDFLPNANAVLGATSMSGRTLNQGLPQAEDTDGYTLYDLTVNYDTERYRRLLARRGEPHGQVLLPVLLADRLLPQLFRRPGPDGVAHLPVQFLALIQVVS